MPGECASGEVGTQYFMTSEKLIEKLHAEAHKFCKERYPSALPTLIHEALMTGALIALEMSREDDQEILRRLNAGLSRKD